jgi:hypothetical protein
MEGLQANPFSILTFIVAPAILTNASSVMTLGTSNRFARAIDRARTLTNQIEGKDPTHPETILHIKLLHMAEHRAGLLMKALSSFYLSLGCFAAASLVSLLAAVFFVARHELLHQLSMGAALCAGVVGVGGLVTGSSLLVWETRITLGVLGEETAFILKQLKKD